MARRKTTTTEEEPKTEPKSNVFDVESAITKLEIPEMLKVGFKFYIINNNVTVKSENDLQTKLNNFKQMNAGE